MKWLLAAACAACATPGMERVTPLPAPAPDRVLDPRPDEIVADNRLACPAGTRRLRRMIPDPDTDAPTRREQTGCLLPDGGFHGPYRRGREDGTPIDVGAYDHGLRVGHWRLGIYEPDGGHANREADYLRGLLDGAYAEWWSTDQLMADGRYSGGKRVGHWRFYAIVNGVHEVASEGDFVDGKEHGTWVYTNAGILPAHTEHWDHGKRIDPAP